MEVFYTGSLSNNEFDQILSVLHAGSVIGFPTDTAYGLGADPFNEDAVAEIFRVKGRPETKPILLLVDSLEMTERIVLPDPLFIKVATAFWPGPLTLVLPAISSLPSGITAGTGTVGVRWPDAPFARTLINRFQSPITATSANRSGLPSCVTAEEVRAQLGESLPILVDGGELPARGGSSLLDLTTQPPTLLREGPISFERLSLFFAGKIQRAAA